MCIGFPDKPCAEFRPKTDDPAKALTACRANLAVVQRRYTKLCEAYVSIQNECAKLKGEAALMGETFKRGWLEGYKACAEGKMINELLKGLIRLKVQSKL